MIRTLLIIAGAAFVLAMASLAGAVAIGGRDMAAHGWEWTFHDKDGDKVSFVRDDGTGPSEATRTLAWAGGDRLIVDLPGDITYIQGAAPGITVTGPAGQIERVHIDGDRLTWDEGSDAADTRDGHHDERVVFGRRAHGAGVWVQGDRVHVVVTAPSVTRFDLQGSADLTIRGYDQPDLRIDATGSGDVNAVGKTTTLTLNASGSGDFDLSDLATTNATVETSGSGDASIAATGAAVINSSGSGDIDLVTAPASLRQSIKGSGGVSQD